MKTALFFNFTSNPFTGYWDGKPKTFKPGEKVYMPEYLAKHYAKHLTNKVLLEQGKETATSPKFPEQVPQFMEIFNQACILEDESEEQDEAQLATDIANRSHTKVKTVVDNKPVQIVPVPGDDEGEEEFEGLEEEAEVAPAPKPAKPAKPAKK